MSTTLKDYGPESNRLHFLLQRDGIEATCEFAKQTMVSYRRQVLQRIIPRHQRKDFIESYLAFKRFLVDFAVD